MRCLMPTTRLAVTSSIPRITSHSFTFLFLAPLADAYSHSQDESSEQFIGEWAEQRGIRDELVIATKVRFYASCCRTEFVLIILFFHCSTPLTTNVETWPPRYAPTTLATVVNPSTSASRPVYKSYARHTSTSCMYTFGTTKPP